jgi:hypothetical protein
VHREKENEFDAAVIIIIIIIIIMTKTTKKKKKKKTAWTKRETPCGLLSQQKISLYRMPFLTFVEGIDRLSRKDSTELTLRGA